MRYKLALFIGRFQPFHLGHLFSLEKCFELAEETVVGIGSSQESGTENNPWDFETRREMVESLPGVSRKVKIVAVPDLFNDKLWGEQIIKIISERGYKPEEVVGVGNNEWTNRIFKMVGIAVYETGLYNRDELEGVKIRKMIKEGNPAWEVRVPENICKILKK